MSTVIRFEMESGKSSLTRNYCGKSIADLLLGCSAFGINKDITKQQQFAYAANSPVIDTDLKQRNVIILHFNRNVQLTQINGVEVARGALSFKSSGAVKYNISGVDCAFSSSGGIIHCCLDSATIDSADVETPIDESVDILLDARPTRPVRESADETSNLVSYSSKMICYRAFDYTCYFTRFNASEFRFTSIYYEDDFFLVPHGFYLPAVIVLESYVYPLRGFKNPVEIKTVRESILDQTDNARNKRISELMYGVFTELMELVAGMNAAISGLNRLLPQKQQITSFIPLPQSLIEFEQSRPSEYIRSITEPDFSKWQIVIDSHKLIDWLSNDLAQPKGKGMLENLEKMVNGYPELTLLVPKLDNLKIELYKFMARLQTLELMNPGTQEIAYSHIDFGSSENNNTILRTFSDNCVVDYEIDLISFQWSLAGTYFIDSLTMYLYASDDDASKGAAAAKGLTKRIPRALGRSQTSHCMLLYARKQDSANDPLNANDLDHLLDGYLRKIGSAEDGIHIDGPLVVVSRTWDRAVLLPILWKDESSDEVRLCSMVLPEFGYYDPQDFQRKSFEDVEMLTVVNDKNGRTIDWVTLTYGVCEGFDQDGKLQLCLKEE